MPCQQLGEAVMLVNSSRCYIYIGLRKCHNTTSLSYTTTTSLSYIATLYHCNTISVCHGPETSTLCYTTIIYIRYTTNVVYCHSFTPLHTSSFCHIRLATLQHYSCNAGSIVSVGIYLSDSANVTIKYHLATTSDSLGYIATILPLQYNISWPWPRNIITVIHH